MCKNWKNVKAAYMAAKGFIHDLKRDQQNFSRFEKKHFFLVLPVLNYLQLICAIMLFPTLTKDRLYLAKVIHILVEEKTFVEPVILISPYLYTVWLISFFLQILVTLFIVWNANSPIRNYLWTAGSNLFWGGSFGFYLTVLYTGQAVVPTPVTHYFNYNFPNLCRGWDYSLYDWLAQAKGGVLLHHIGRGWMIELVDKYGTDKILSPENLREIIKSENDVREKIRLYGSLSEKTLLGFPLLDVDNILKLNKNNSPITNNSLEITLPKICTKNKKFF